MATLTEALCGVLVLDKPSGWTSHDAVNKTRRFAGTKKIGHLGTLDPLATGVLPLVVGRATRLAQFYVKDRKAYQTKIRFGFATDTYDRDGKAVTEPRAATLDAAGLERMLDTFRGRILQTPPPVSAKKINGVAAYKLARANQPVELKPVEIESYRLENDRIEGSRVMTKMESSPGS